MTTTPEYKDTVKVFLSGLKVSNFQLNTDVEKTQQSHLSSPQQTAERKQAPTSALSATISSSTYFMFWLRSLFS